jgi:GNAT superfamily N-acetyltransferase
MKETGIDTTVRRATPNDAPELAEIHVAAWRQAYRGIVPDWYLEGFTVESRTRRSRDTDVDQASTAEIWGIYVSPQYWRRGVGRFLCEQGQNT